MEEPKLQQKRDLLCQAASLGMQVDQDNDGQLVIYTGLKWGWTSYYGMIECEGNPTPISQWKWAEGDTFEYGGEPRVVRRIDDILYVSSVRATWKWRADRYAQFISDHHKITNLRHN